MRQKWIAGDSLFAIHYTLYPLLPPRHVLCGLSPNSFQRKHMYELATMIYPVAAIGYSKLLYLLFGGGFFGAVVIFFAAKMLGR